MKRFLVAYVRFAVAYVRWLVESVGYTIRPYDMLADRRRWRWQGRTRCGPPPWLLKDVPSDGQWVARSKSGQILATAPTARLIIETLAAMGMKANGATARFEQLGVSSDGT